MYLFELFEEPPLQQNDEMRQTILDVLTPLVAQKVPFVTVQQIEDKLRDFRSGIALDRGFIMDVLDPSNVEAVQKIEGDKIFLNTGGAPDRALKKQDVERDQEKMAQNAAKQAQKDIGGTEKQAADAAAPEKGGQKDASQMAKKAAAGQAQKAAGGAL